MAKAAATLLVLLSCLWPTVQAVPHNLSCSFTVEAQSIPTDSLPQCSVDGVPFHPYDKDNKRKEGNAPKECANLFSKLKDIEQDSWRQLHTKELLGDLTRGNHILQVTMVSQYKKGQVIDAYCSFTLDEQHSFIFNLKNRKWTEIHNNTPGIDKWKKNTELAQHLATFLIGDYGHCLKTLLHWEKMPRSTSRTPDIGNVTSPSQLPFTMNTTQLPSTMNTTQLPTTMNTTQTPSTKQPPCKGGSSVTEGGTPIVIIILIILAVIIGISICIAICICIYKCVKRKSRTQGRNMGYKLCSLDSCIFGNCRGQHTPSAVGEPCPEETICMTVMSPLEGDSPHCLSASSS